MKSILKKLKRFFFPPVGSPRWVRILPYVVLGILTLGLLISGAYGWEYTNSPEFCGTACHTMPPEYTSYLTSPHARVDCVDCHIGKGFITTKITRKAGDAKHIIRLLFKDYEFPITAGELRPARETCELCHFPEKFSDDSLREIPHFANDTENTSSSIYLIMKTGGGSTRLGLGKGIHWHIENSIEYYATENEEQKIPYVRVHNEDGSTTEYFDTESTIDFASIDESELESMDCITCHNRITHLVNPPEDILDQLLARKVISPSIPDIRRLAIELFYRTYETQEDGLIALAGLKGYYEAYFPDYLAENNSLVDDAIVALQEAFAQSVYPEAKSDWASHPNNIGHEFSPGCFRCHDGKHLSEEGEAVRLECNLCHSIPEVVGNQDFVADIEISRGPEPKSHLNTNWISLHHQSFDQTCAVCHTIEDPGGTSNTSFCSNSACHGSVFEFAGFDAPSLRNFLLEQYPPPPKPTPTPEVIASEIATQEASNSETPTSETSTPEPNPLQTEVGPVTFNSVISPLLQNLCSDCHGPDGLAGLDYSSYETTMLGSENGAVVIPGDPENSLIIIKLSGEKPHFAQFSDNELSLLQQWISEGAVEN